MPRLIHLETRVIALFGVEDGGDMVQQFQVAANPQQPDDPLLIKKLSEEAFAKAFKALTDARQELSKQVEKPDAPGRRGPKSNKPR